jgi:polysaccharide pyruvyl transferase WcaK-like protein
MGPVKALPYLTASKTRQIRCADDARDLFERWRSAVAHGSKNTSLRQQKLKHRVEDNWLTRSRWFQKLDNEVRLRLARGILETVSPYLFRSSFASDLIERIENSDLVIFNGGAFVADHLDQYLPMVLFELYLAKKLEKPTAVVNQTIAIRRPSNNAMVSFVYSLLDGHWVREPRSKQVLQDMGIDGNRIHLSCDAAFGLPLPQIDQQTPHDVSRRVGICVRGDRPVPTKFWAEVSKYLTESLDLQVRFFFTSMYQDKKAYDKINELYPGSDFLEFCDYPELIHHMQGFDFIITDRYHATIFAILAAIPFITLDSNTFKTRGLMDMVDYPIEVMENDANFELIVKNIERVRSERSSLAEILRSARIRLSQYAKSSIEPLNTI